MIYAFLCLAMSTVALLLLNLYRTPRESSFRNWEKYTRTGAKVIKLRRADEPTTPGLNSAQVVQAMKIRLEDDPDYRAKVIRLEERRQKALDLSGDAQPPITDQLE